MSGERVRWFGAVRVGLVLMGLGLVGLGLTVAPGCDSRRQTQDRRSCRTLDSQRARGVCQSFADALAKAPVSAQQADDARQLVFRSFCDGRTERVFVEVPTLAGGLDQALAEAVERGFRRADPAGDCAFTAELLVPRGPKTAWAAVEGLDEYRALNDGLLITDKPREVITPLDFSVIEPKASTQTLRMLPNIYRRQSRNPGYLALETTVQPHDVHAFVLLGGALQDGARQESASQQGARRAQKVQPIRYHRMRHDAVTQETLTEGVRRGVEWFETMRDEANERFYYEYNPYRDEHVDTRYNLLRHAGSSWAIMQAYGLTGDEKTRELGEYALDWVEAHSRTEEEQGRAIRFVVEPWNNKSKLGGAGLWLLALAEHARLTGDTSNIDLMQQIANYIYFAQDPETGQFESFHDADGLRMSDHVSDYYPGEAMFGLHRARPFLSDVPVCEITRKGLEHMLSKEPRQLAASTYRFVNQWNTYTVREYRRDCDDHQFDWVWRRDLEHMLVTTSTLDDDPVMAGAYQQDDGDFSTSPTRLEALTTICAELGREDAEVARRCEPVVRRVAGMQLSFQHGPTNSWFWGNPDAVEGGFAHGLDDESIRIDFTQHHMSAMYNAVDFLRHVAPDGTDADSKVANSVEANSADPNSADTARSFPFNLVGEATCGVVEGAKCL